MEEKYKLYLGDTRKVVAEMVGRGIRTIRYRCQLL